MYVKGTTELLHLVLHRCKVSPQSYSTETRALFRGLKPFIRATPRSKCVFYYGTMSIRQHFQTSGYLDLKIPMSHIIKKQHGERNQRNVLN